MSKKKITIFFIVYLLFSIAINLVHPITVKYVNSLELPDSFFGFFFSLMSLGQVVGALIFGALADKIGRKWLVVIGILGYCFAQFGFGFINFNPYILLTFRFLSGLFISAPNALFISMCLDYSNETNKVKMFSILTSCQILGSAFGYEIGGAIYNYLKFSISEVFIFQICFSIIVTLLFAIFIKDVYVANKEIEETNKENNTKLHIKPIVYLLLSSLMVLTIAQILINKYLDTYIIHIGYEPATLGHYVLITGIIGAISNILVIPFIKKIKNKALEYTLLGFILISAILTFITFGIKVNNILYLLFTTHLVYIVIKGLITPLEQNELSIYTNANNKGKIAGYRHTILSIGNVLGPLIGSALYTKGSPLIFIVAAFIIIFAFIMYSLYFILKNKSNKAI